MTREEAVSIVRSLKWRNVPGDQAVEFAINGDGPKFSFTDSFGHEPINCGSYVILRSGEAIAVESRYDEGWSEYTPGDGIQAPLWWIGERA